MRFIHTADWQIGKPFKYFGEKETILRHARLKAIETIGHAAEGHGVRHVLLAGDMYDTESPAEKTLSEPLARMQQFTGVTWHVISGNHDPHRANGLWDRVRRLGVPANIRLHLDEGPVDIEPGVALMPAPLRRKSEVKDLTEWMAAASSPAGTIRIGLAHGSITGFGSANEAGNPIAPDRAQQAGLDYLALGDWHRTMPVNPRTWYAGTPEPDRFASQENGQVLLVDIPAQGAAPQVTPISTGQFHWRMCDENITCTDGLADLGARLRAMPEQSSTILRLSLKGALPLSGRTELERLKGSLEAALFHLDLQTVDLVSRPSLADLETIDFGGVLREAAETLQAMADDPAITAQERHRAEDALVQLYLMSTAAASDGVKEA